MRGFPWAGGLPPRPERTPDGLHPYRRRSRDGLRPLPNRPRMSVPSKSSFRADSRRTPPLEFGFSRGLPLGPSGPRSHHGAPPSLRLLRTRSLAGRFSPRTPRGPGLRAGAGHRDQAPAASAPWGRLRSSRFGPPGLTGASAACWTITDSIVKGLQGPLRGRPYLRPGASRFDTFPEIPPPPGPTRHGARAARPSPRRVGPSGPSGP